MWHTQGLAVTGETPHKRWLPGAAGMKAAVADRKRPGRRRPSTISRRQLAAQAVHTKPSSNRTITIGLLDSCAHTTIQKTFARDRKSQSRLITAQRHAPTRQSLPCGMPGLPSLHRQLGRSPSHNLTSLHGYRNRRTRECVQRGHRCGCRKGKPPDICGLAPFQAI